MATTFYYTAHQVMRRAGRKSANAAKQLMDHMPAPDAVVVAGRPTSAWTLGSWRVFAGTRNEPLRSDLMTTLAELAEEERELEARYGAYVPAAVQRAAGGVR